MDEFSIKLLRQPQKYLDKLSDNDAEFIRNGLNKLRVLDGDIKALSGMDGYYRLRVRNWRIIRGVNLPACGSKFATTTNLV